ncbi:MAG: hypothetical protein FJX67_13345 [Alphaproteobacteria bacterium]|nr:hypothetical protein [Alphaproteobacteria bacterium]
MTRHIRAMYWSNIAPRMLDGQAAALAALGYTLRQDEATGTAHDAWIETTLAALGPDDTILLLDIDCIPLNRAVVERAFAAAEAGALFGVAQAANHLDAGFIYDAPAFLALARRTWEMLGWPSFAADARFNVGARLSAAAQAAGVAVELLWPSFTLVPRWPLAERGCYGIGTFYDGSVFHLFQSRHETAYAEAFDTVARAVAEDRPIDYLALHARANSAAMQGLNVAAEIRRRARKFRRSAARKIARLR